MRQGDSTAYPGAGHCAPGPGRSKGEEEAAGTTVTFPQLLPPQPSGQPATRPPGGMHRRVMKSGGWLPDLRGRNDA
jgi:hypothetical protein